MATPISGEQCELSKSNANHCAFSLFHQRHFQFQEYLSFSNGGWGAILSDIYARKMGNKGAFIRFESPSMEPNVVTFSAVAHPNVKPMAYASNFLRMFS